MKEYLVMLKEGKQLTITGIRLSASSSAAIVWGEGVNIINGYFPTESLLSISEKEHTSLEVKKVTGKQF